MCGGRTTAERAIDMLPEPARSEARAAHQRGLEEREARVSALIREPETILRRRFEEWHSQPSEKAALITQTIVDLGEAIRRCESIRERVGRWAEDLEEGRFKSAVQMALSTACAA